MGNKQYKATKREIEHIESIQFAIRNLETLHTIKLKKIQEESCCEICYKNIKDLAFGPCGHVVCKECGLVSMKECPFCRSNIEYKLILYM